MQAADDNIKTLSASIFFSLNFAFFCRLLRSPVKNKLLRRQRYMLAKNNAILCMASWHKAMKLNIFHNNELRVWVYAMQYHDGTLAMKSLCQFHFPCVFAVLSFPISSDSFSHFILHSLLLIFFFCSSMKHFLYNFPTGSSKMETVTNFKLGGNGIRNRTVRHP